MWLRLRQIALVAHKLEPIVEDLEAVFGLEVGHIDPGVGKWGLHNVLMPVGSQFLEIVAPTEEGTPGGRYLERRGGDGGYMVITQCDTHPPRRARVEALGIRTVLDRDSDEHKIMQLHPKDSGGSFLEIDWAEGGEDPAGPWPPAGFDWQKTVRTDVISAITAAEIQCDDPGKTAARWAEIIEQPLSRDGEGRETLQLENATIRFIKATDGRGEGLGGIDVTSVDGDRARAVARERGLVDDQGAIMIGGLRYYLSD